MPPLDAIEAIRQRMEMLNLNQKDVARYFGEGNRFSEMLNKKKTTYIKYCKEAP